MKSTEYALADEHRVQPTAEANAKIESDAFERKYSQSEKDWQMVVLAMGNGARLTVTDSQPTNKTGFYCLRRW